MKAKLRPCTDSRGDYSMVWLWCPGCDEHHAMPVSKPSNGDGPMWTFNGDEEKPTLSPSILVRGTKQITDEEAKRIMKGEKIEPIPHVCHSFVTDGKIQFLGDCTHKLVGQTVDLPEVED